MITNARVPKSVVDKLRSGMVSALQNPAIIKRLEADGSTPVGSTPEQFTAHIRSEMAKWSKLAKAAKLDLH